MSGKVESLAQRRRGAEKSLFNKRICSPLTRLTFQESRTPLGVSKSACLSSPRLCASA